MRCRGFSELERQKTSLEERRAQGGKGAPAVAAVAPGPCRCGWKPAHRLVVTGGSVINGKRSRRLWRDKSPPRKTENLVGRVVT